MVRNWTLKNENEMKFLEEFKKWNLIKISNYLFKIANNNFRRRRKKKPWEINYYCINNNEDEDDKIF